MISKKIVSVLISASLILTLVGCGNNEGINDVINKDSITTESNNDNKVESNKGQVKEKEVRIYFFDAAKLQLVYTDKKIKVVDNALCTALTKELQEGLNNEDLLTLPKEVGVKSANLDKESGILSVNLSKDYVNLMTLGTATEGGMLSAVVNTYGYNYGVDKVALYFDGKLYTGLVGELPEGYWTVNYDDALKLEN